MANIFRLGGSSCQQTAYALVNRGYFEHNITVTFNISNCRTVFESFSRTNPAGDCKSQVSVDNVNWVDFTLCTLASYNDNRLTNQITSQEADNVGLITDISAYNYYRLVSSQAQNQGQRSLFCKFDNVAMII